MKTIKNLALIILSLILFSAGAVAQAKKPKTTKTTKSKITKPVVNPMPIPPINPMPVSEYKILVEGAYSKVETPFVFVARDAETYALIRSLVEGLPASSTVDFTKSAVIAAFAGTKNTGGWSVAIRPAVNKIVVDIRQPPKGAMTAQVITTPFQVALVPAQAQQALLLELTEMWTNRMKTYRVSKGSFEYSGGIAGRTQKFDIEGTIDVLSYGDHVTYNFNLSGKGNERQKKISEMASGIVNAGRIEIARLDAGTFAEMPHPPVKVSGTATDQKISLSFESHPPMIADGFMARGKLEAVKIK